MKTALVIGGTGLTGKKLLRLLLADKRYAAVKVLVRKPMDIIYEKLEQIVFDFDNPESALLNADDVFCCLGTTIKEAGSKDAFYKVDFEYVITLARLAHANGCKNFAIVSSMGANKDSYLFYNKTKGQVEEAVKAVGFENCFIFRPSLLLGTRNHYRMGEAFAKCVMSSLAPVLPKRIRPIHSKVVAFAMEYVMNSNYSGFKIFESDDIATIAEQLH